MQIDKYSIQNELTNIRETLYPETQCGVVEKQTVVLHIMLSFYDSWSIVQKENPESCLIKDLCYVTIAYLRFARTIVQSYGALCPTTPEDELTKRYKHILEDVKQGILQGYPTTTNAIIKEAFLAEGRGTGGIEFLSNFIAIDPYNIFKFKDDFNQYDYAPCKLTFRNLTYKDHKNSLLMNEFHPSFEDLKEFTYVFKYGYCFLTSDINDIKSFLYDKKSKLYHTRVDIMSYDPR